MWFKSQCSVEKFLPREVSEDTQTFPREESEGSQDIFWMRKYFEILQTTAVGNSECLRKLPLANFFHNTLKHDPHWINCVPPAKSKTKSFKIVWWKCSSGRFLGLFYCYCLPLESFWEPSESFLWNSLWVLVNLPKEHFKHTTLRLAPDLIPVNPWFYPHHALMKSSITPLRWHHSK